MRDFTGKITFGLFLVLGLMSCDSTSDSLPDDGFNNAQDFEIALNETYNGFLSRGYYGGSDEGDLNSLPEVLGDNVILNPNGRSTKKALYDYNFDPANTDMGIYISAYSMIYNANLILYNLELHNFHESFHFQIASEARALRAIAHFDVVKFYGKIPSQGGELGLGIPYITDPDQDTSPPARLELIDTYNKIISDLEFAFNHIDSDKKEGRLNKEAIALYLSRIYLYLGGEENNMKASQYASEVTTQPTQRNNLADVFTDDTKDGVIFHLPIFPTGDGSEVQIGRTWGKGSNSNRASEFNVTPSFYAMYSSDDIRKEAFMKEGKDDNGDHGVFISKLWGKDGSHNGVVDLKILRAEEAILNKAEAEYKLGNHAVALAELNRLRSVRYDNFTPGDESEEALWEAIKLERRLEFAFEYHRFIDIKRWGEDLNRFDEGHQKDGSGQKPEALYIENSDPRFVQPFSQESIIRNPNLIQNPGY
ncbi:MAG TPA: RagB/SusD family nutrient uptake outer membrane protein [Flavobacteriaceae bacterium]|nr:RagB/SusD family nutrient uptake outer membrane protein [Flavobacteriaceae bacterium]